MNNSVSDILQSVSTYYIPGETEYEKIEYIRNTLSAPEGSEYMTQPLTFGLSPLGKSNMIGRLRSIGYYGSDNVIRDRALIVIGTIYKDYGVSKESLYNLMESRGFTGSPKDLKILFMNILK